ncbi:MAG: hypothetical protein ACREYA_23960 [Cupriavidus necator]
MVPENLAYALTQVLHNFGAVAAVGGAAFALWASDLRPAREAQLVRLVSLAWAVQVASGVGFGAVSYYYYERLPDIHGVAIAALATKIACAAAGLALALTCQFRAGQWNPTWRALSWRALAALAATALVAAAFLRWFS